MSLSALSVVVGADGRGRVPMKDDPPSPERLAFLDSLFVRRYAVACTI